MLDKIISIIKRVAFRGSSTNEPFDLSPEYLRDLESPVVQQEKLSGFTGLDVRKAKCTQAQLGEVLRDVTVVAAGVRMFLDFASSMSWVVSAGEADADGQKAKLVEQALMVDPLTPWRSVVRRALMYRFYGFSVQEWRTFKRPDGFVSFKDIGLRPQESIDRWKSGPNDEILGAWQVQADGGEALIPRSRIFYMVDDAFTSSPFGLGILRQVIPEASRLARYKALELYAFDSELRGVPLARAPLAKLKEARDAGALSEEDVSKVLKPMRDFLRNPSADKRVGFLIDSQTYVHEADGKVSTTTVPHWDLSILKGGKGPQQEIADAIRRTSFEIALLLGIDQVLLGESGGSTGSHALSRDKSRSLHLQINSALLEVADVAQRDLVKVLQRLNGWSDDETPVLGVEQVRDKDVQTITEALLALSRAGVPVAQDDPVVKDIRTLLGVSQPTALTTEGAEEGAEEGLVDDEPDGII